MNLDQLARDTFSILGAAGIPAEIIGGYALAHYGYVRNTMDIDVVVRDHEKALEVLKAHGYVVGDRWFALKENAGDQQSVDILPAGRKMSGSPIPNPTPTEVSTTPKFTTLETLVAQKVGVTIINHGDWAATKKNEADVGYLIRVNHLPTTFLDTCPDEVVRFQFGEIWDAVTETPKNASIDPFSDFFSVH